MSCETVECSICYDAIASTNNCTTPCGHIFCFKCMVQSLGLNNTCPCCRAVLVETLEEEEDDESEYSDDEEDNESEYSDDEEEECGEVETITERLVAKGYTMTDLVSLLSMRKSKRDSKYTTEYYEKLETEYMEIVEEIDREVEESRMFAQEDKVV